MDPPLLHVSCGLLASQETLQKLQRSSARVLRLLLTLKSGVALSSQQIHCHPYLKRSDFYFSSFFSM